MARKTMNSMRSKSASAAGRTARSGVFGQSNDKKKKKSAFDVPNNETPKQLQRRLLKLYERNCAADNCKVLNSVKRTIREGVHSDSLQARVG